jgi:hypothetical protein
MNPLYKGAGEGLFAKSPPPDILLDLPTPLRLHFQHPFVEASGLESKGL